MWNGLRCLVVTSTIVRSRHLAQNVLLQNVATVADQLGEGLVPVGDVALHTLPRPQCPLNRSSAAKRRKSPWSSRRSARGGRSPASPSELALLCARRATTAGSYSQQAARSYYWGCNNNWPQPQTCWATRPECASNLSMRSAEPVATAATAAARHLDRLIQVGT